MSGNIYIVIGAILAAPFLGVLVDKLFSRKADDAAAKTANIVGEKTALDMYKEYTNDIKLDFDKLKKDFAELSMKFDSLREENDNVKAEKETLAGTALKLMEDNKIKDRRISDLEERVKSLEEELASYKNGGEIVDLVANTVHDKIDEEASDIKENLKV